MKLYFKNFEIYRNISIYSQLPPPGAAAKPLGLRGAQVGNLCCRCSQAEGQYVTMNRSRFLNYKKNIWFAPGTLFTAMITGNGKLTDGTISIRTATRQAM